ncbi:hypothetical protein Bpfe_023362 [Biomphalaria pfeifferi]|uniref:Uncharacterized protein n=1 Tax=Biomphalaria pfeifferi TaxID=112525 RepID=A0AAD8B387_BIOPF|nr:hypothetical protein Bpfe_023362 [Biomphalaria pfeifferi]
MAGGGEGENGIQGSSNVRMEFIARTAFYLGILSGQPCGQIVSVCFRAEISDLWRLLTFMSTIWFLLPDSNMVIGPK